MAGMQVERVGWLLQGVPNIGRIDCEGASGTVGSQYLQRENQCRAAMTR